MNVGLLMLDCHVLDTSSTMSPPQYYPPTSVDRQLPYDVVVSRRENEGFGFIIVSSVNRVGAVVGEFCIGTYQPMSVSLV